VKRRGTLLYRDLARRKSELAAASAALLARSRILH